MSTITILSVSFGDGHFIRLNRMLTQKLNPQNADFEWIVVDNSRLGDYQERSTPHFTVVEGVAHEARKDKGSYHHALGLHTGLKHIKTRYVLIIDHDFYVIRPNWIEDILNNMKSKDLSFFGSVWNPFWDYQYRYFPSVHFMLIDLERVPLENLDFMPGIEAQPSSRILWLNPFRIGRLHDTGYMVRKRFASAGIHKDELLIPYFLPSWKTGPYYSFEKKFRKVLPDRVCLVPKRPGYFVTHSFLEQLCPHGFKTRWEEFYWNNDPFAFHLRNVARDKQSPSDDMSALEKLIND